MRTGDLGTLLFHHLAPPPVCCLLALVVSFTLQKLQFDEVPIGCLLLFPSPQRHIYKEDPMANVKDVATYLFFFLCFQVSHLGLSFILNLFFICMV